jgi:hypothetical protein
MKHWTAGELPELEQIADACDAKAAQCLERLSRWNTDEAIVARAKAAKPESWTDLQLTMRRSEFTASALRDFCAIQRGERTK